MKVFDLEFDSDHYYIKRSRVVQRIAFDNRTFYAKFERIEERLTPLHIKQHLHKEYTIAVPLLTEGHTNYLVIEYKGSDYQRFYYLVKHLFTTEGITAYHAYQGKEPERIQIFIEVPSLPLNEATEKLQYLSEKLQQKMTKKWKCLPSATLPEAYNIVTLPYGVLDFSKS